MKSRSTLTALVLLPLLGVVSADTIRLKNGTTYQGKIIKEDPEQYVFEVQITKSIKDEKRIPKADVASVERELPDQKAFSQLSLEPAADLFEASDYQARIAKMYGFIKAFPQSTHLPEVKKVTAQLEQEQSVIEAGGVKLNGKMIATADRQKDAVEIDAKILAAKIQNAAKARAYVSALRQLGEFEKDFSTTDTFRDSLATIRQIFQSYRAQIAGVATSYPQRVKERDAGLGQMQPEDRANTERALAEESKAVKTQYDADKKAGLKWLTPDQWDKPALDETLRYIDQEMKRFDNLKIETEHNSGKAWRDAWAAIQGRDQQAVTDSLKTARTSKMPARYLTRLEDATKAAGMKP